MWRNFLIQPFHQFIQLWMKKADSIPHQCKITPEKQGPSNGYYFEVKESKKNINHQEVVNQKDTLLNSREI